MALGSVGEFFSSRPPRHRRSPPRPLPTVCAIITVFGEHDSHPLHRREHRINVDNWSRRPTGERSKGNFAPRSKCSIFCFYLHCQKCGKLSWGYRAASRRSSYGPSPVLSLRSPRHVNRALSLLSGVGRPFSGLNARLCMKRSRRRPGRALGGANAINAATAAYQPRPSPLFDVSPKPHRATLSDSGFASGCCNPPSGKFTRWKSRSRTRQGGFSSNSTKIAVCVFILRCLLSRTEWAARH